jgi:CubicO group peptidase (beta-lactamase class C family)
MSRSADPDTSARVDQALRAAVELGEVGVQVAAYLDGELVVDAWTGAADPDSGALVDGRTLFAIFSVSKAVTATALHIQAERGLVDYDAPLARYWPEFAAHGKGGVTVRHVLTHRAGVPSMPPEVTPDRLGDWDWVVSRLAELEPLFGPGERSTYLSYTFGWLIGEVVRRTDPQGREFAQFVTDEICTPLGMDSFFFGVPSGELGRVAPLLNTAYTGANDTATMREHAVPAAINFGPQIYNLDAVRQASIPAAGGIANARSVARFFAMVANGGELGGVRLLSAERVESFLAPRPDFDEVDLFTGYPAPVGVGGFQLGRGPVIGEYPRILMHGGAGGSIAWADLDTRLSVAICHNRMFAALPPGGHPFTEIGNAVRATAGIAAAAG